MWKFDLRLFESSNNAASQNQNAQNQINQGYQAAETGMNNWYAQNPFPLMGITPPTPGGQFGIGQTPGQQFGGGQFGGRQGGPVQQHPQAGLLQAIAALLRQPPAPGGAPGGKPPTQGKIA